jgi:hypothetical protein
MIELRPADTRGSTTIGWLDARHSFAFGRSSPAPGQPHPMGFRSLRVINDDRIAPGGGFDTHPHDNMEILSYVVEGHLEHKDSTGTVRTIGAGEAQLTSAGSGITHSEYNPSREHPTRLLQIWVKPRERGIPPRYQHLPAPGPGVGAVLLADPAGASGSMAWCSDARLWLVRLAEGGSVELPLGARRYGWVQIVGGGLTVNGHAMGRGDGAAVTDEPALRLRAESASAALVFDLD